MSLIEKYGSYEQAVKTLWQEQEEGYPGDDIARELLEYRRENNIFEPEDYIIDTITNQFFKVLKVDDGDLLTDSYFWVPAKHQRHATNEEIQIWKNI